MAEVLKAKPVADAMKADMMKRVEALKAKGTTPKLGIIRVGARPDDLFYEGGAKKTCTGVGMDCEIKNKVFTTFFTTKGLGGTGLGLMVTRKIVQQHGGRINMESTREKGSTFRIELPRDRLPKPSEEHSRLGNHKQDGE